MTTVREEKKEDTEDVSLVLRPPWPTEEEIRKAEEDEQRRSKEKI